MRSTDAVPSTTPAAMAKRQAWAGQYFASATTLPLLFVFDEKIIAGIPAAWQPVSLRRRLDANRTETVFEGTDPATGLRRDGFTFTLPRVRAPSGSIAGVIDIYPRYRFIQSQSATGLPDRRSDNCVSIVYAVLFGSRRYSRP